MLGSSATNLGYEHTSSHMDLKEFYDNVQDFASGKSITYNGLTLEKAEAVRELSTSNHTEVTVYNNGSKVESLTFDAMEFHEVESLLDEIAEVDPSSIEEWLNRNK